MPLPEQNYNDSIFCRRKFKHLLCFHTCSSSMLYATYIKVHNTGDYCEAKVSKEEGEKTIPELQVWQKMKLAYCQTVTLS